MRSSAPNARFLINDRIYDSSGKLVESYDPRAVKTEYEYDSRGRQVARIVAADTPLESKTETVYDPASNVLEVRSPRYFDANDTLGYQKAKETWTYNGRGLAATHTEAPTTAEAATESFAYDLSGRRISHTDFAGKVWETHY